MKLMVYKAKKNDLTMSENVLCTELKDIKEVLLLYSVNKAEPMLTKMITIQQQLFELFDLGRYAPKQS